MGKCEVEREKTPRAMEMRSQGWRRTFPSHIGLPSLWEEPLLALDLVVTVEGAVLSFCDPAVSEASALS